MEHITHLDTLLFYFLNGELHRPFLDEVMPFLTRVRNWDVFLGALWLGLMLWGGRRGRTVALLLIPAVVLVDQFNDHALKPFFGRVRPCHALPDVRLLVAGSKSASFPSSHAWNSFTVATIISHFYSRPIGVLSLVVAAVVAFSRIYVGLHYPLDVLAGALLGILSGTLFVQAWRWAAARRAARAEAVSGA
jgi:undecaprenyl-diphosphatase